MAGTFERWGSEVVSVADDDSRRALITEVSGWRVAHLMDVPGNRDSAWALSVLYQSLGETDQALHEARQLVSLCQTPPAASDEQWAEAKALLAALGGGKPLGQRIDESPKRDDRSPKKRKRADRSQESQAERGANPLQQLLQAGLAGDWSSVLKGLRGKRGGKQDLVRAWARLGKALALDGDDRETELKALHAWLGQKAGVESAPQKTKTEVPATDGGELRCPLPRRPQKAVRVLDGFLRANPGKIDYLAATALRDHLEHDAERPAPWLISYVARALVSGGEETRAALDAASGALFASAYREPVFERAVSLLKAAKPAGWTHPELRRGVDRRMETGPSRLWTLRLSWEGEVRMLVLADPIEEAKSDELATALAGRLLKLCPRVVLYAPGEGHSNLRGAVLSLGAMALDGQPAEAELLAALKTVQSREPSPSATSSTPTEADTPAEVVRDLMAEFVQLWTSDELPSIDGLGEVLGQMRRMRVAVLEASRQVVDAKVGDADARTARLLAAAHSVAPERLRLPEGTTLGVQVARSGGEETAALLLGDEAGSRFGGPGMSLVLDVVRGLPEDWKVDRVLSGLTRQEKRANPLLQTLSEFLSGLWRVVVTRGDQRGELWVLDALAPEGRAGVPQLLLNEGQRLAVLSVDGDLIGWAGGLEGLDVLGWEGIISQADLQDALGTWG